MKNKGKIYKLRVKKHKKNRKRLKKKNIIIGSIIIYLMCFFSYQAFQIHTLKKQEKALNEKKLELEQEKNLYAKQLEEVNSPEYIEKMARQSLRMVMKNELLYVIQESFIEQENDHNEESESIKKNDDENEKEQ